MVRKFIQIAPSEIGFYALSDDGTIWQRKESWTPKTDTLVWWERVLPDIPQDSPFPSGTQEDR